MATGDILYTMGSVDTVLSTGLNSMANNALVLSSEYTASQTGYLYAMMELYISGMGGTPTANTSFDFWFLSKNDGTNYEDGSASVTPARAPDGWFNIRAVSTAQRLFYRAAIPPSGTFKILIRNNATGQALAASGNTLKLRLFTERVQN